MQFEASRFEKPDGDIDETTFYSYLLNIDDYWGEEDYYNVTLAFEDDAFNIALSPFTYREDSLEEVKEEISNVTLADDDGAWLFAHKIINITFSPFSNISYGEESL